MSAKTMRYSIALTTVLFSVTAAAQNRYALGPVETSNSKADVVVLGQRFTLDTNTRCIVHTKVVSKQLCTLSLSKDVYAVVEGDSVKLDRAASITVLPYSYVPGASTVMAGGRVSAVRPDLGNFRVGDLSVSNAALLAQGSISLRLDEYVEVVGTQPQANDVLLANGLRFSPQSTAGSPTTMEIVASQTVTGTGIQTITGTGIQTITGTGIQTITGTGIQTITGTGIQTITGTGTQTITGTGAQTITGTGTQTITGTGAQTITGTGTQTITGTGAQTITGTGTQTITGTGAQTITGTGTQTITGTGAQTITGTGKQTITGTGTQTITGTGKQTITGTGTQTITGTGKQTITGTGY